MSTTDPDPLAPLLPYRSSTCIGISVPDGWVPLMLELHEKLVAVDPDIAYSQAKEKYGSLRVYLSKHSPETEKLIRKAERRSERTCESCGRWGSLHRSERGWLRTLCSSCASEHEQGYTPVKSAR